MHRFTIHGLRACWFGLGILSSRRFGVKVEGFSLYVQGALNPKP